MDEVTRWPYKNGVARKKGISQQDTRKRKQRKQEKYQLRVNIKKKTKRSVKISYTGHCDHTNFV